MDICQFVRKKTEPFDAPPLLNSLRIYDLSLHEVDQQTSRM